MKIPEYKDIEELHLMDKIKIFGWLSDMLTHENPEVTIHMHEDKIRRIKKYMETQSD